MRLHKTANIYQQIDLNQMIYNSNEILLARESLFKFKEAKSSQHHNPAWSRSADLFVNICKFL